MTLGEMQTDMLRQARVDVDLYEGFTLDENGLQVEEKAGLTRQLNRAKTFWCQHTLACHDPRIVWTLTASEDEYDIRDTAVFSRKIMKPRFVIVNDATLLKPDMRTPGLWTMAELKRERFAWWTYADSVPTIAVFKGRKLILSAPPAATYSGKNFVDAWYVAADLNVSNEDSEYDVLEDDHYWIVQYALALCTAPMATEAEGLSRVSRFESNWRENADRRRRENLNEFIGSEPRGSASAEWMYG